MPRLRIPDRDKAKTKTFSLYDPEWSAIRRLVLTMNLHQPFDVVRLAIAISRDPKIALERENFQAPKFASARTMKIRRRCRAA